MLNTDLSRDFENAFDSVNDISDVQFAKILIYADDITLFFLINCSSDALKLQGVLEKLSNGRLTIS